MLSCIIYETNLILYVLGYNIKQNKIMYILDHNDSLSYFNRKLFYLLLLIKFDLCLAYMY